MVGNSLIGNTHICRVRDLLFPIINVSLCIWGISYTLHKWNTLRLNHIWETFPFAWFRVSKDSMINFKSSVKHKHTYMYDMKSW